MKFRVCHQFNYQYSKAVFFEPHRLYLRPREDGSQRILNFDLKIDPAPSLLSPNLDRAGNVSIQTWFNDMHDHLTITATSEIETLRTNPFNFIINPSVESVPVRKGPDAKILTLPQNPVDPEITDFSNKIAKQVGTNTFKFLAQLNLALFNDYEKLIRPEGAPWEPTKTINAGKGSCRDLTLLFNECCRAQGLAARFVSGYFEGDHEEESKDLHAWSEVYLEDGGWRGFDPTYGLATADHHIPLAANEDPREVSPVIGTYRGTGVTETVSYTISLKAIGKE